MSKNLWTSAPGSHAPALAAAALILCGVLAGCGPPPDAAALDDGPEGFGRGALTGDPMAGAGTQEARLGLSASELRFGQRCPGDSATRSLELRSIGSSSLTIRTLSVRGVAFRLVRPPQVPAQLLPGERMTLTVRFRPPEDRPGDRSPTGTLIINTSDGDRPSVSVPLRGSVPPTEFDLRPSTLDFGPQRIGLPRSRSLELTNTGACPLGIGGLDVTGEMADAVLVGDEGASPIGAGQSRDVDVIVLCERRGAIDARVEYFTTFGESLGAVRVRGSCRP